jgi:hypothetical protein
MALELGGSLSPAKKMFKGFWSIFNFRVAEVISGSE